MCRMGKQIQTKHQVLIMATNSGMFKPSVRQSANLGRMTDAQIRAEYTRQSKVANKRISAIEKAGYYSPSVHNLNKNGVTRFGLKNQGLKDTKAIRSAYRDLMDFLNSTTSNRTGIKTTIDKMVKNFNMKFDGNYIKFSQKSKDVFDMYEDIQQLAKNNGLGYMDKYDTVHDLDTLYEEGVINEDMSPNEVYDLLKGMAENRKAVVNEQQNQLHFNWRV